MGERNAPTRFGCRTVRSGGSQKARSDRAPSAITPSDAGMRGDKMKIARWFGLSTGLILLLTAAIVVAQQDPEVLFAVVTKVSKDRRQVTAQVSSGGVVSEATLIASEAVLDNLIWK